MNAPCREHRRPTMPAGPHADTPRVLLVEDDADQRQLIAWMLRAEGCDVVEAENGIALLNWIAVATSTPQSASFDAIVADINMPDLTAIEVLSGWRYGNWSAPLIFVTACGDPRTRSEARALGASTILAKPVRQDELRQALEPVLARRAVAAADGRREMP